MTSGRFTKRSKMDAVTGMSTPTESFGELHMEHPSKGNGLWSQPRSRGVGLFTDPTLYAEALQLAHERSVVTASYLQRELGQRLRGLLFVEQQSLRVARDLVRELRLFGWLQAEGKLARPPANAPYTLTPEGHEALAESRRDGRAFQRRLAVQLHQVYIVPGWFVNRLWQINPQGQGEVILPTPLPGWQPQSRPWVDCEWNAELEYKTLEAAKQARLASPVAFPIAENDWVNGVREAWRRLSTLSPRGREAKKPIASYGPRRRLAQSMLEAAVTLLFGRVPYDSQKPDFPNETPPLYSRTFRAWCPRLESLEFIFYTDWHPKVRGRLLFPTALFRSGALSDRFKIVPQILHPDGRFLYLHQPAWPIMRDEFWQTLIATHQRVSRQVGSLYVSLLDVRDEVCRQLRLSAAHFDEFLGAALQELPRHDFPWSISIETDIREEQRSGYGLLRRPVYIQGIPHTLIAVARLPESEKESR